MTRGRQLLVGAAVGAVVAGTAVVGRAVGRARRRRRAAATTRFEVGRASPAAATRTTAPRGGSGPGTARQAMPRRPGDQDALVVLRPGETRLLDCRGWTFGQVVVVLPVGCYEACQLNVGQPGAGEAALVDIELRDKEAISTWLVTRGGPVELGHRELGAPDRVLVAHVHATDPGSRYARL